MHLIAFAALAFPLARTGRFGLLPVFIGASAFGGAIELIQPSFNRSADVNDWIADIVGVILGIGLGLLYRRLRKH
ncbi:MAG: VanZ family protein [Bacteroidetes bacterium]|nr:VanZ family protein [Bacteroidota bacterium]MDA0851627.1 VanZ family protein [Pseudomonadota bacterium]